MKNTKLWIADPDLAYVQAFAEYVNLKKGYLFQITHEGLDFANKLKVSYAEEYRLAVETVVEAYRLSESHMLKEINRYTLQSLQEDSHE